MFINFINQYSPLRQHWPLVTVKMTITAAQAVTNTAVPRCALPGAPAAGDRNPWRSLIAWEATTLGMSCEDHLVREIAPAGRPEAYWSFMFLKWLFEAYWSVSAFVAVWDHHDSLYHIVSMIDRILSKNKAHRQFMGHVKHEALNLQGFVNLVTRLGSTFLQHPI